MATSHLSLTSFQIDAALALCDELKSRSHAKIVALIDAHGRLICRTSASYAIEEASLGALCAATMAAHQSLARLIGEAHFPDVTHRGAKRGVHLCLLARDAICVVIFDTSQDNATLMDAVATSKQKIDALFDDAHTSKPDVLADVSLKDIDNLLR